MNTPITDLSQSGLTKEQIKTLRENYTEERVFRNPKPSETFDVEEYKQYRQEREDNEGEFESFSQWKGEKDGGSSL